MKVLVDANILISIMLSPRGVPGAILDRAISGSFSLLVSEHTLAEVLRSCRGKPYIAQRVSPSRAEGFVDAIRTGSIVLPTLEPPFEPYTRDPKDDYLIAHALAEDVDILVSGDRDLLALNGVYPFRILAPAAFIALLHEETAT